MRKNENATHEMERHTLPHLEKSGGTLSLAGRNAPSQVEEKKVVPIRTRGGELASSPPNYLCINYATITVNSPLCLS